MLAICGKKSVFTETGLLLTALTSYSWGYSICGMELAWFA
jgi:hypothetical protein